jgi:hypothetical protein
MSNTATVERNETSLPTWLADWKNEPDTLAVLRKLKPSLHRTTLIRMREAGKIEATKFANQWFYKPESALPKAE